MNSTPTPLHLHSLSLKAKLPVKRKTPEIPSPTAATPATSLFGDYPRPPPFKFHRIWTEPDEIRFLQGLLNGSSDNLSFPRDLNIFYARFSNSMSQPYTKSQLSEKLRRLRKKFRVISTRLSKGLDPSLLSPHDRALYNLSKRLWHPDFSCTSPFSTSNCIGYVGGVTNYHNSNSNNAKNEVADNVNNSGNGNVKDSDGDDDDRVSGLVGVKVSFSRNLEIKCEENENGQEDDGFGNALLAEGFDDGYLEVKLSEVNVEFEECIGVGSDDVGNCKAFGNGVAFGVEDGDGHGNSNGDGDIDVEVQGEAMMVGRNGNWNADEVEVEAEVELVGCNGGIEISNVIGEGAGKVVMDVFNEALEEARKGIMSAGLEMENKEKFEKRWQKQSVAELDVFAQRMRLILERSLPKKRLNR